MHNIEFSIAQLAENFGGIDAGGAQENKLRRRCNYIQGSTIIWPFIRLWPAPRDLQDRYEYISGSMAPNQPGVKRLATALGKVDSPEAV